MARFNVTVITFDGSTIHHAHDEIHDSLCWALSALGHSVAKTENWFSESGETNVILGAELMADFQCVPANSILVNLEQPSHPRRQFLRTLARDLTVWDFLKGSSYDWDESTSVRHLPIGYTPNLARVPRLGPFPLDVFFAGWMTPRRTAFLDQLRAAGLKVFAAGQHCYGGVRDEILSRSKLALNIHHDGREHFEIVRCSYLMANRIPVVTETSVDDSDYRDLSAGLRLSPLKTLPGAISELLASPEERDRLAGLGYAAINGRNFTDSVAAALDSEPKKAEARPANLWTIRKRVADCYRRAVERPDGDMRDFMSWLEAHAQGNIVEIGTRVGASTSAFLTGVQQKGGHVWSIDIDGSCAQLFPGHPNWTFIHSDSKNLEFVLPQLPSRIDLLFIDGDHSAAGVAADFRYSMRVSPGGMVLIHDIEPEPPPAWDPADWPDSSVKLFWQDLVAHSPANGWSTTTVPGRFGLGVLTKHGLTKQQEEMEISHESPLHQ